MPVSHIERAGLKALLLSVKGEEPDIALQSRIWKLDVYLQTLPFITETSPGVNSLLVEFSSPDCFNQTMKALSRAWDDMEKSDAVALDRREVVIPVIYGGASGADVADLSRISGLTLEQIATLHAEGEYDALCLGAHPGFAYLAGLSPHIYMPRKKTPALFVKQGSVVIGGPQTGIIAATLPSGWNVIGHTDTELFNALKHEPALIRPGDRVRFTIVDIINVKN